MTWKWSKWDHLGLARFVSPDAESYLRLSDQGIDSSDINKEELIKQIYGSLLKLGISYSLEKYDADTRIQLIRPPSEILEKPGKGTCLDLAAMFCGVCLGYNLLPLLIILEGHAIAAVSRTFGRSEWQKPQRTGSNKWLKEGRGKLEKIEIMHDLITSGEYWAIECTGFSKMAKRESSEPECNGRDPKGFLNFERAKEAGRQQLDFPGRNFHFAIDIEALHAHGFKPNPLCDLVLKRVIEDQANEADKYFLQMANISAGKQNEFLIGGQCVTLTGNEVADAMAGRQVSKEDADIFRSYLTYLPGQIRLDANSRTLQDYFRALRSYADEFPYISLYDRLFKDEWLTLDEVYIPLRAYSASTTDVKESRGIDDILQSVASERESARLLFMGGPGTGKSTLLKRIAKCAWDAPEEIGLARPHLAMVVCLRSLSEASGISIEQRLFDALKRSKELVLKEVPPEGFLSNWPRQADARWLFLLDGMDEVPEDERAAVIKWLKHFLEFAGENQHHVIITSRPNIPDFASNLGLCPFNIQPLEEEDQERLAKKLIRKDIAKFKSELSRVKLGDLSSIPLLLTIAAVVYRKDGELPKRRVSLYDRFVDICLAEAKHTVLKRDLGEELAKASRNVLEHLALATVAEPKEWTTEGREKTVCYYLRKEWRMPPAKARINAQKFLDVMGSGSGVLICREKLCEWLHPTFGEYLAASELLKELEQATNPERWKKVVRHWNEEDWREVVLFLLGGLGNKNVDVAPLLRQMWESDEKGPRYVAQLLSEVAPVNANFTDDLIKALNKQSGYLPKYLSLLDSLISVALFDETKWEQACDHAHLLASHGAILPVKRIDCADVLYRYGFPEKALSAFLTIVKDNGVEPSYRKEAVRRIASLRTTSALAELENVAAVITPVPLQQFARQVIQKFQVEKR